jgi:hypothetical protein
MKTPALLALLGAATLLSPASGTILLNEININPPTDIDANFEFIELRSTTNAVEACTGLTLLIIENNGGQVGEIEEALNLNDYSTGTNGLLLLGNGYDSPPLGGPWSGFKAPTTTVGDPSGAAPYSSLGDDNIDPNGGLTFLLVQGYTALANATATSLGDVDVNNNSVLDWLENPKPAGSQQTQPYTTLVDSVGFPDLGNTPVRRPYTTADLNLRPGSAATFAPDNISRRLSRAVTPGDQNNAGAWYGGNLAGATGVAVTYDIQFFGDFKGQGTPGQTNLDAAPVVGNFVINEVGINPPGGNDNNYEYVEILNAGGGAASLQGLALVLVRSNANDATISVGTITEAWNLNEFTTGANSLLLLGNDYPSGDIPWGRYIDPETQIADPEAPATQVPVRLSSMGDEDIGDNNGFTLLLVQNYNGTIGQDLDTNNDGVLDVNPWTAIKDSVGFDQTTGTGKTYAQAKLTPSILYDIDNVSRTLGNTTTNSAGAWYGGDYGGNSPFSIGFQDTAARPVLGGFRGAATPGRTNLNASPTPAAILLNEVQLDPAASPDGAYEYLELINTTNTIGGMHGLTLVIADGAAGADNGKILESIDLSGLSTGPDGLMIMGDGYDTTSPYDSPLKQISPLTAREDPAGLDVGNIAPNSAALFLITKGAKPATESNISAIPAADIVDSIGFGASSNPAVPLLAVSFAPDNFSRRPREAGSNSASVWYGGDLDSSLGDGSLFYGPSWFGAFKGGASPGRLNHASTPSATATLVLNELNINPPNSDSNIEFLEFRALPSSAVSTNGYTLLQLDSSGSNTGTVVEAWSLDGLATGTNGLLLAGSSYPTSVPWTGADAPAAGTAMGSPLGLDPADIAGISDNGAVSFLLVRYFTGRVGQDLDAGVGSDGSPSGTADDGNLDITPWNGAIADAAGMRLWDTSLVVPALTGRVYGGVDLSQALYTPDSIARRGDNNTANTTAAWYGGNIDGTVGTATAYVATEKFPAGFAGLVTPGKPNVGAPVIDDAGDEDNDGVVNLIELATNMNPAVSDAHKLPQTALLNIGGVNYPTLSHTRFTGGTTVGQVYSTSAYRYEVQASLDLVSWTGVTELVSTTPTGDGQTETAVLRPETAYFNTALSSGGKIYMRLKISRP